MPLKENNRNYPLRRQSALTDFKPKVVKNTCIIISNHLIQFNPKRFQNGQK